MATADTHSGHLQLTLESPYGALWSPVAAANPDAAALLEMKAQVLLQGT